MIKKIILLLTLTLLYNCSPDIKESPTVLLSKFNSKVFEVSTENAIIVWDEAKDLNSNSTHYSITLNNKEIASDLEGVTYTFKNLSPKTTYNGIIKAEDQLGKQSIASFTFKTSGKETVNQAAL